MLLWYSCPGNQITKFCTDEYSKSYESPIFKTILAVAPVWWGTWTAKLKQWWSVLTFRGRTGGVEVWILMYVDSQILIKLLLFNFDICGYYLRASFIGARTVIKGQSDLKCWALQLFILDCVCLSEALHSIVKMADSGNNKPNFNPKHR